MAFSTRLVVDLDGGFLEINLQGFPLAQGITDSFTHRSSLAGSAG